MTMGVPLKDMYVVDADCCKLLRSCASFVRLDFSLQRCVTIGVLLRDMGLGTNYLIGVFVINLYYRFQQVVNIGVK